jgi:hypothetical protein
LRRCPPPRNEPGSRSVLVWALPREPLGPAETDISPTHSQDPEQARDVRAALDFFQVRPIVSPGGPVAARVSVCCGFVVECLGGGPDAACRTLANKLQCRRFTAR